MKPSHLNGLRALEATLRNGTFSAASEELGVTVAAIGQQIRSRGEYLGVKLFDRHPTGAKPTEAARRVATQLAVGFGQIEDALGDLGAVKSAAKLRVSTFKRFHEDWLTERMPRFHDRAPRIEPEFKHAHIFDGGFLPVCTPEFAGTHGLAPSTGDLTGVTLFRFIPTAGDAAIVGWPELLERHAIRRDATDAPTRVGGVRVALSGQGLVLCGLASSLSELPPAASSRRSGPGSIPLTPVPTPWYGRPPAR